MTISAKCFWVCILCLIWQTGIGLFLKRKGYSEDEIDELWLYKYGLGLPGNLGVMLSAFWWIISL